MLSCCPGCVSCAGTVCGSSPNLRSDVMLNAMVHDAVQKGEVHLYVRNIRRPVLGISDLCRGIQDIIAFNKDVRGLYNMASFNGTVVSDCLACSHQRLTHFLGCFGHKFVGGVNSSTVDQFHFFIICGYLPFENGDVCPD